MRNTLLLFWLFLGCVVRTYGQSLNQDSLLNQIDKVHDTLKIEIYKKLATYYQDSVAEKSIHFAEKGLEVAQELNSEKLEADFLNRIGVVYDNISDYPTAMQYYTSALERYEKSNDLVGLASTCNNMGYVNLIREDYDKARVYFSRALQYDSLSGFDQGIAMGHANLASVFLSQKSYKSAIDSYLKSLQIFIDHDDERSSAVVYNNLGEIFDALENYDSAIYFHNLAISIKKKLGNEFGLVHSYSGLGRVLMHIDKLDEAKQSLDLGLSLARKLNMSKQEKQILKYLSEYHERIGNFENALLFHKEYKLLEDSIFNKTKSQQINDLELKYETAKKAREIEQLTIKSQHQNRLIKIGMILGVLLVLLLILIYNRFRLKHALLIKDGELSAEKNQRLQDEIDARNRELVSDTMNVIQKNELLENVKEKLNDVSKKHEIVKKEIREVLQLVQSNINFEKEWEDLKLHFEKVHPRFFEALNQQYPDLTQHDLKYCAYIKLNLSNKEVARMLNVDAKSVRMSHYRLKKKLNLDSEQDLSEFVQTI